MAVASPTSTSALPSTNFASLVPALEQLTAALSSLLKQLQTQAGTGAQAGAANISGAGSGSGASGGVCQSAGCCGAGGGALSGAAAIGPAPKGSAGAPPANGRGKSRGTSGPKGPKGVAGAPKAGGASRASGPNGGGKGAQAVDYAKQFLGTPYSYGATGPDAFDCSGFTSYVMKHLGADIPRTAREQAKAGTAVEKNDLKPGDLVFFQGPGKSDISHTGIYVGDGKFIHAPKTGDVVKISSLDESYYQQAYRSARRFV